MNAAREFGPSIVAKLQRELEQLEADRQTLREFEAVLADRSERFTHWLEAVKAECEATDDVDDADAWKCCG